MDRNRWDKEREEWDHAEYLQIMGAQRAQSGMNVRGNGMNVQVWDGRVQSLVKAAAGQTRVMKRGK
jgi:hypothetical protein